MKVDSDHSDSESKQPLLSTKQVPSATDGTPATNDDQKENASASTATTKAAIPKTKSTSIYDDNATFAMILVSVALAIIMSAVFYNNEMMKQELADQAAHPPPYVCHHGYTIKVLNQSPFILYIEDFLQPGEADHIKELAEPRMKRSGVTSDDDASKRVVSSYRTSHSASLDRNQTAMVNCIEERASYIGDTPIESIETLQVVRYYPTQQYKPHTDYLTNEQLEYDFWGQFGVRYATILAYIHDPEEGGDTTFTRLGISVRPRKNDAIFWINMKADGTEELDSEHSGDPVVSGEKWAINIWLHKWNDAIRKVYQWKGERPANENNDDVNEDSVTLMTTDASE